EAFKSLSPNDFSFDDLQYANSNLLILSGLYGVLKPLDRIMTYRLEMRNQVKFWKDPITEYIKNETENSIIVDLCSSEYSKAINFNNIKSTIITPDFKSLINGKLKSISVFSKQMRGLLAKEIILNRVKTEEELQKIDLEGYTLENITNKNYLYVRK
ncbi:MAG: YaaA family protein, partial [Spirochaetales bacterium]|nr:YaaA family protein [Spirochaetales bacterium]